jgi:small subunit ribosomal protein S15
VPPAVTSSHPFSTPRIPADPPGGPEKIPSAYIPTASSSSSLPLRAFSTTAPTHESKARRKARLTRKTNLEKKVQLVQALESSKPDPVKGYAKGNEGLWEGCLLKSVLLDRSEVWGETVSLLPGEATKAGAANTDAGGKEGNSVGGAEGEYVPKYFNFGLDEAAASQLVSDLPAISAMSDFLTEGATLDDALVRNKADAAQARELEKRNRLVRLIDLRNSGSKGIEVENKRRIIRAFGRAEGDTGSPEVQGESHDRLRCGMAIEADENWDAAAIMTSRIHSLSAHLITSPRDIHNRRPLRSLIQQRTKVLKYLQTLDVKRYEDCLNNIGVEPRAVQGEVIVTKRDVRTLIRGE